VRKVDNGTPVTIKDSVTSSATLDVVIPVKTSGTAGFYEVFTCEVSDANNMKNSINFTIYTLPADPGIVEYKSVILASFQLHTFAHYFSISNGLTYDTADCVSPNVQELIDIAYFDNQVYGHTMMSPNVTFLNNIYPGMVFWTNKNKTQFSKTLITTGAFDAIETIVDLTNAIQNAVDDFHLEFVDSNEEGDVLAFKNSDGINGLIRINNTQTSANHGESFITFDVKIEK
jgi:hypothetical protein